MIPVSPAPEPPGFDKHVRQKGNEWLNNNPGADSSDYKDCWNDQDHCRSPLQKAFHCRCAYLGHWIPKGQVDHFIPKSANSREAYEWTNYRYAEASVNNKKRAREFLDPFTIDNDWIEIDPVTLNFKYTNNVPPTSLKAAKTTVDVLNDKELVDARKALLTAFGDLNAAYEQILDFFPLLARSLQEAGLVKQPEPVPA
ncbi:MAG: hypothetical protein H7840_01005 [Alphaproteobacteria bacterium]